MNSFPAVDPIPLPAPIWLFKLLHIVTLSLHFVAVEILLGGLLLAVFLSTRQPGSPAHIASRAMARRLTVVMTYVINLGVPPLLFAQVLYGRALYTSSVLIGAWWISIIVVLTLTYWLLYQFSFRLEAGKSAWLTGLLAWLGCGLIARLLSTNMTLMLRPEAWRGMYSASGAGVYLPTGDPTTTPRFVLMLCGGLFVGGLWMLYLAGRSTFTADEKSFLAGFGGKVAALFGVVYLAAGVWANSVQPADVKAGIASGLGGHPVYHYFGFAAFGWLLLVAVTILLAAAAGFTRTATGLIGWSAALLTLLFEICFVVYRDAVRDVTLLTKGYDVWNRVVVTNWSVVGIFLVLFVASLGVIAWLISVVARATKPMENAA